MEAVVHGCGISSGTAINLKHCPLSQSRGRAHAVHVQKTALVLLSTQRVSSRTWGKNAIIWGLLL